eukprot:g4280.t1
MPFNFTCVNKYGCVINANGRQSEKAFPNGVVTLKTGETTNKTICSGGNEALDIAPLGASFQGIQTGASFSYKGIGYFFGFGFRRINLDTMSENKTVCSDLHIPEQQLPISSAFQANGMAYLGGKNVVYEFTLDTCQLTRHVPVHGIIKIAFQGKTPYDRYGYFGSDDGFIFKIHLDSMKLEMSSHIEGKNRHLDYSVDNGEQSFGRGFFANRDTIYCVDLSNITNMKSVEVPDQNHLTAAGYAFSAAAFGSRTGMIYVMENADDCILSPKLSMFTTVNEPILSLISLSFEYSAIATYSQIYIFDLINKKTGGNVRLNSASQNSYHSQIVTWFYDSSTGSNLYYAMEHGMVLKLSVDHNYKRISFPIKYPIGMIGNGLHFPPIDDIRKYFTLFSTNTTDQSLSSHTIDYIYVANNVYNFDELPCGVGHGVYSGLCRRVNLATTQMKIVHRKMYTVPVLVTLLLTQASIIYRTVLFFTKHAPKVSKFLSQKCCKNEINERNLHRNSDVELPNNCDDYSEL